jgi:hypothetical protein
MCFNTDISFETESLIYTFSLQRRIQFICASSLLLPETSFLTLSYDTSVQYTV